MSRSLHLSFTFADTEQAPIIFYTHVGPILLSLRMGLHEVRLYI